MNTANSGMSGIDRRWWKVAAVVTVVALTAAVGIWAVTRDTGDKVAGRPHAGTATRVRTALLAQVKPRPSCPDAPAAPAVKAGQKLISVVRVVNHCLAFRGQAVASNAVPARLAKLRADPGVVAADLPAKVVPARPTTGPKRTRTARWAMDDLQADQVRKLWPAGADVRVAIVDTGIDDSNPDLTGQVAERAPWSHIYHGNDDFHGTHVAGIVAAKDDGKNALGLTPQAKLLDDQYWDEHGQQGGDIGEKIRWAVDHGASVLNMSFGGPDRSDTEEAALLYAEQAGVVAVASAGNCGNTDKNEQCDSRNQIGYPAAYNATVVSVANYTRKHTRSSSSTTNDSVDLAAPGDNILSTNLMPHHELHLPVDYNCQSGKARYVRTCVATGTSMAAPFVSATAALLRARHPDATPAAIREAILRSTRAAPGHEAGVHSDEFGTGLLDPVAAADYLDQHPKGTTPGPTSSADSVAPDTIVAGYLDADHKVTLTTAGGSKISIPGVGSAESPARMAFSRDGTWFAAADGAHLALVNVQSRRQQTIDCSCSGVAFNDKGQLLTADADVIATYEPATASKLHGTQARNTSGIGLPTFLSMSVEGSAGDVTLVKGQFASAGYGAFGVRPDGSTFLLGRGEDPGVDRIVLSDDRRWVAWSMQGVCHQPTQLGLADLSHPGTTANIKGPTADGEALQIRFEGDKIVADWAPMQHNSELCAAQPPWPPTQWQSTRPAMGTGTADNPAAAQWSRASDQRSVLRQWPSGEGLYLEPTTNAPEYDLTFGPAPGGGGAVPLAAKVTDAVAAPGTSGQTSTTPPTQSPAPPTSSAPQQPPPSPPPATTKAPSGSPATTDAALARYVQFLHALGHSDAATICEIAGPAMKEAEAEGIGPCPTAFQVVFQMISPTQREALKTATVDRAGITVRSPQEVYVPAAAIKAAVSFTSEDVGDRTLGYQHGQWYITG